MDYKSRHCDDDRFERCHSSPHGEYLVPSPSSIPSLIYSSTPSRPTSTETGSDHDPQLVNLPGSIFSHRGKGLSTIHDGEELEYVYDSQGSAFDSVHSNRPRNRASGGFFHRLLRRPTKPKAGPTPITESPLDIGHEVSQRDSYDTSQAVAAPQCWPLDGHNNPNSRPLSSAKSPGTDYLPESPILGSSSPALVLEGSDILPNRMDSVDFDLDLDSFFENCARDIGDQAINNPTTETTTIPRPMLRIVGHSTPLLTDQQKQFKPLPNIPSTVPLFPSAKASSNRHRSSITRTLQLFPSPPTRPLSPVLPPTRLSRAPHTPRTEEPPYASNDHSSNPGALPSLNHQEAAPLSSQLEEEYQTLSDEEEGERLLREHELMTNSLRYEDAARSWEPFHTLWAAELSQACGGNGRRRSGSQRRSFGCW